MGAKYIVPKLSREQSRRRLKQKQEQRRIALPTYSVSWDDLAIEREKASAIPLPESVEEFFFARGLDSLESRTRISQGSIERLLVGKPGLPSIMQSVAYMLGKQYVDMESLQYCVYWLWNDLESYGKFMELPQEWIREGTRALKVIIDLARITLSEVDEANASQLNTNQRERLINKVGDLANRLQELAGSTRDKEAVLDTRLFKTAKTLLLELKQKAQSLTLELEMDDEIPF
jgi:hypothetical protein